MAVHKCACQGFSSRKQRDLENVIDRAVGNSVLHRPVLCAAQNCAAIFDGAIPFKMYDLGERVLQGPRLRNSRRDLCTVFLEPTSLLDGFSDMPPQAQ